VDVIKIENLSIGMAIANYKEVCKVLDVEVRSGDAKKKQLKWFEEYFKYLRQGNKFIIIEIINRDIKPMVDNRGGAFNKIDCPNCLIEESEWKFIGVYSITQNNKIYIGSTTDGFRTRFLNHRYEYSGVPETKDMLGNSGTFQILKVCNGKNETEIRKLENDAIYLYRCNPEWDVVNKNNAWSFEPRPKRPQYKAIKVLDSQYDTAREILLENNIIMKNKVGERY